MASTWILVWLTMGQQPVVLTGISTQLECQQIIEDVLKQVPKKPRGPIRRGWCVPDLGIDTIATEQETTPEGQ